MKISSTSRKSTPPKLSKKDLSKLLKEKNFPCPLYHRDTLGRTLLDPVQLPAHFQQKGIRCNKNDLQVFLSNYDSNDISELLLKGCITSWFIDYLNKGSQNYIETQLKIDEGFKSCKIDWFCLRGSKWSKVNYIIPENEKMPKEFKLYLTNKHKRYEMNKWIQLEEIYKDNPSLYNYLHSALYYYISQNKQSIFEILLPTEQNCDQKKIADKIIEVLASLSKRVNIYHQKKLKNILEINDNNINGLFSSELGLYLEFLDKHDHPSISFIRDDIYCKLLRNNKSAKLLHKYFFEGDKNIIKNKLGEKCRLKFAIMNYFINKREEAKYQVDAWHYILYVLSKFNRESDIYSYAKESLKKIGMLKTTLKHCQIRADLIDELSELVDTLILSISFKKADLEEIKTLLRIQKLNCEQMGLERTEQPVVQSRNQYTIPQGSEVQLRPHKKKKKTHGKTDYNEEQIVDGFTLSASSTPSSFSSTQDPKESNPISLSLFNPRSHHMMLDHIKVKLIEDLDENHLFRILYGKEDPSFLRLIQDMNYPNCNHLMRFVRKDHYRKFQNRFSQMYKNNHRLNIQWIDSLFMLHQDKKDHLIETISNNLHFCSMELVQNDKVKKDVIKTISNNLHAFDDAKSLIEDFLLNPEKYSENRIFSLSL